jgi:predicted nucleic acid-binding protein
LLSNKSKYIVADSSFYLCFLEDIQRPEVLLNMLNEFDFITGGMVYSEICRCKHFKSIDNGKHITLITGYDYGELLKPFFSKYEIKKGEAEAIGLAALLYGINKIKNLILDEDGPRFFVENNLPHLTYFMTGTVGFIGKCCCDSCILNKESALNLLSTIENSSFRVSHKVLNDVRNLIKRC